MNAKSFASAKASWLISVDATAVSPAADVFRKNFLLSTIKN